MFKRTAIISLIVLFFLYGQDSRGQSQLFTSYGLTDFQIGDSFQFANCFMLPDTIDSNRSIWGGFTDFYRYYFISDISAVGSLKIDYLIISIDSANIISGIFLIISNSSKQMISQNISKVFGISSDTSIAGSSLGGRKYVNWYTNLLSINWKFYTDTDTSIIGIKRRGLFQRFPIITINDN